MTAFSVKVCDGLKKRGITMRQLCRTVELDPSFFSKVLAGKRSPPAEEDVLRRIASALELDAPELIVSAGRLPREWEGVWTDAELFRRVHSLASGRRIPPPREVAAAPRALPIAHPKADLSEELL